MFDHFDWIASIYERLIPPPETAHYVEKLRLPIQGWLLDAGGGTGRVSSRLHNWTGAVAVVDSSRRMLNEAIRKNTVHPIRACTENLPFADECFERILVVDALHHFRDPFQALAELARILKSGGRLLIQEPNIHRFPVKVVAFLEKIAGMQSRMFPYEDIAHRLGELGLFVQTEPYGRFSTWAIADKSNRSSDIL